jgi:hypothetical protein
MDVEKMKFWAQPLGVQLKRTLVAAIVVQSPLLIFQWYVVSSVGYGGQGLHMLVPFLALPLPFIVLSWPILLILLLFRRPRRVAVTLLLCGGLYFLVGFSLILIGPAIRTQAFEGLASRSTPLVTAITKFTEINQHPPNSLQELIPDYLKEIPGTGMPAYPTYEYSIDSSNWHGNPWALYVHTPSGLINWDMFIYLPLQNYPERGFGGGLERISTWAYVHE